MGFLMMLSMLVGLALLSPLSDAAPVSKSLVVLVESPVLEHEGRMATLPCRLSPPQNAEALEVRWYRGDRFDHPIIYYRNKKLNASREASYVGRASIGLGDTDSGGLRVGDLSLTLQNVTIEDVGDYICYVSSDQGYDRGTVRLDLMKTGSIPLLSLVSTYENRLNVSCQSDGWYPRPTLLWSNGSDTLRPSGLEFSNESSGVWTVHSWLLVPTSSEVSCSVGPSSHDKKKSRVRLEVLPPPPPTPAEQNGSPSSAGWVAFALLLLASLALLGILWFKLRRKSSDVAVRPTTLQEAKKHYENITLKDRENKHLKIVGSKMRDNCDEGTGVMCLTAIRGTPGFTSGKHYWEVLLWNSTVGVKESWWLGVTRATDIPPRSDVVPEASNGFWFLSSSPDSANRLEFSSDVKLSLSVSSRPQTVGVYLDYSSGELTFYNVEQETVVGSFTVHFQGTVFPLFNPGRGDKAPMEILKRSEQEESRETGKKEPQEVENGDAGEGEPGENSAMIPM